MTPAVSVILPCHRGHGMLARAIESCLDQTLRELELILVLHRADDSARAIAEHFEQLDARVRVLRSDQSFVDAVNAGHAGAKSEFVARMDSDDIAYPERLERQLKFLESRPDIAVTGCLVHIADPDGDEPREGFAEYGRWVNSLTEPEEIAAQRFVESPVVNPTAMFRRSVFESVEGYKESVWAEDYDLFLRLIEAGYGIAKVPRVLHRWTDHPDRITRTDSRYSLTNFQEAKAHFLSRLRCIQDHGVVLLGAGPTGKSMANALRIRGIQIQAYYEIHPRRIGERIRGTPIRDQKDFKRTNATALGAVAQRGQREKVRDLASLSGYREGLDFFSIA
ncbi:MAG: glycosyltransferase [Verrucomicrobiota bacterium]